MALDDIIRNNTSAITGKKTPPKEMKPVVTTPVVEKKKTGWSRFKTAMFSEDFKDIGSHIVRDLLIPKVKSFISDTFHDSLDTLLYGAPQKRTYTGSAQAFKSSATWSGYYTQASQNLRNQSVRPSSSIDSMEYIFANRWEAEEVLEQMCSNITEYGRTTIADFKQLSGKTPDITDFKYGWTTLSSAQVINARGQGYCIIFPPVVVVG